MILFTRAYNKLEDMWLLRLFLVYFCDFLAEIERIKTYFFTYQIPIIHSTWTTTLTLIHYYIYLYAYFFNTLIDSKVVYNSSNRIKNNPHITCRLLFANYETIKILFLSNYFCTGDNLYHSIGESVSEWLKSGFMGFVDILLHTGGARCVFLFFARNFSFLSSINGLRIYLDWCWYICYFLSCPMKLRSVTP